MPTFLCGVDKMNAYQLLQDVLHTPTELGHYWHNQYSLAQYSGLTQSNISKQLNKLVHNGVVKVDFRDNVDGKSGKYYCLISKLNCHESAQHTGHEQLRSAVEVLANDLKNNKKLNVEQYRTLLLQIKNISASVKGQVKAQSPYDRQYNKLRSMFKNLTDDEISAFTTALLAPGANRGAITDQYLTLNAEK